MTRIGPVFIALRTIVRSTAGAVRAVRGRRHSVLKYAMALGIAVAAVASAAQADDSKFCDDWSRKTIKLYDENYVLRCLPLSDIDPSLTGNHTKCMSLGQGLANQFTKMVEDRLAECRAAAIKEKGALTPGPKIGDLLKETPPTPAPAQPPAGGGAEYATAITPATIYKEPGGAALKDVNGKDVGIPAGSKFLVLAKKTDPAWYKLKTNPVGWVWGEDVTIGP
jgi:hypothetical protein